MSFNMASLLKHLDELRIFVEEEKPHIIGILKDDLTIRLMALVLKLMAMRSCGGIVTEMVQGGHKPGKHGKPRKLREFEQLSKSLGKLREILLFAEKTWKTQGK